MTQTTVKKWRAKKDSPGFGEPEEVQVILTSPDFWLVVGDEHTQYRGSFFDSPTALIDAQIEDSRRSIKHSEERIARLERTKKKFAISEPGANAYF